MRTALRFPANGVLAVGAASGIDRAVGVACHHRCDGSAALDHARANLRVNAALLGNIETPMMDRFTGRDIEGAIDLKAMGRRGKPEEIAEAVSWTCSDLGAFMTAAAISGDGGWSP